MEINKKGVVEQNKMSNEDEMFEVDMSILRDVCSVNSYIFLVSSLFFLVIYLIFMFCKIRKQM